MRHKCVDCGLWCACGRSYLFDGVEDKDLDRALSAFEDELDRLVEESYDDDGT